MAFICELFISIVIFGHFRKHNFYILCTHCHVLEKESRVSGEGLSTLRIRK